MAKRAGTIDIGINVPAAEIRKAESQLNSLFNTMRGLKRLHGCGDRQNDGCASFTLL